MFFRVVDPPRPRIASPTMLAAGAFRSTRRSVLAFAAAVLLAASLVGGAAAQTAEGADPNAPIPPLDVPSLSDPAGNLGVRSLGAPRVESPFNFEDPFDLPAAAAPFAAPDAGAALGTGTAPGLNLDVTPSLAARLVLTARLTEDGAPIRSGLVWRVFGSTPTADGELPLIASSVGGNTSVELEPGTYFVYCGFGHAGSTVRVTISGGIKEESVVLNAGGLRLRAAADENQLLPADDVRFNVYSMETDDRGERKIVAKDVRPEQLVRLAADTYHVVSLYGSVNAQTRGDVEIKAGKLTEVTLYQRAAEVTLKLVGAPGGEAIADTSWSVLTPGGDIVTEGVGAFPSFVLEAGQYTVIARHDEKVYQRDFEVETGRDAEVEVLAQD